MLQELLEAKPERMIGGVGVLRRAEKNQHQRLVLINHGEIGIFAQASAEIFDLFLESSLAVEIFGQDVSVDAAHHGNQFEWSTEGGPGGIEVSRIVADVLVIGAKRGRAVADVFFHEPFAVEDAADVIGDLTDGSVNAQGFEPRDMLLNDGGIGAVIAASDGLHIGGLKEGHGGAALKVGGVGAEPGFILHDNDAAILVDDQRAGGVGCSRGAERDCGKNSQIWRDSSEPTCGSSAS